MIHFSSSVLHLHSALYCVGTTLSATESYQKALNLSDPPTTRYWGKRGKGGSTFHRMEYTGRRVGGRVFEGMLSTTGRSCGEGVVAVLVSS